MNLFFSGFFLYNEMIFIYTNSGIQCYFFCYLFQVGNINYITQIASTYFAYAHTCIITVPGIEMYVLPAMVLAALYITMMYLYTV